MNARVRADEDIHCHFWDVATARAASIVPLSPEVHHVSSDRVSRNKLGIPQPVQGEVGFKAPVRAG